MSDISKAGNGPNWLVGISISLLTLYVGVQQYQLNKITTDLAQKKYEEERFEKSRSRVKLVHKGPMVEITVEYADPAGFVRSETFEWKRERWEALYKDLREAPPITKN